MKSSNKYGGITKKHPEIIPITIVCLVALGFAEFVTISYQKNIIIQVAGNIASVSVSIIWGWFLSVTFNSRKNSIRHVEQSFKQLLTVFQIQASNLANIIHSRNMGADLSEEWNQGAQLVAKTLSHTMQQSLQAIGQIIEDFNGDANRLIKRNKNEIIKMQQNIRTVLADVIQRPGVAGIFEHLLAPELQNVLDVSAQITSKQPVATIEALESDRTPQSETTAGGQKPRQPKPNPQKPTGSKS